MTSSSMESCQSGQTTQKHNIKDSRTGNKISSENEKHLELCLSQKDERKEVMGNRSRKEGKQEQRERD